MARLLLSLLGSFQPTLSGKPVAGLASNKGRALLAYLAVEADRPHPRDVLATLFWPDRTDAVARTNLRNALSNLRAAIEDPHVPESFLLVNHDTIQFNVTTDQSIDVTAFEEGQGIPTICALRPDAWGGPSTGKSWIPRGMPCPYIDCSRAGFRMCSGGIA